MIRTHTRTTEVQNDRMGLDMGLGFIRSWDNRSKKQSVDLYTLY